MSPREKETNQSVETQEVRPKAEIIYVAGAGEILTPSSIFEFYLQQRRGVITGQYQVIPTLVAPTSTTAKELLSISPGGPSLNRWLKLIDEIGEREEVLPRKEREILTRLARYFDHCRTEKRGKGSPLESLKKLDASPYVYHRFIDISIRHYPSLKETLEAGSQLSNFLVRKGIDPFSYKRGELDREENQRRINQIDKLHKCILETEIGSLMEQVSLSPRISFKIPLLYREPGKSRMPGETRVVDTVTIERSLGRLRILEGNQVSIAIVGPPHSGKSTLTASLIGEINQILHDAREDIEFADLRLQCNYMDLDKSTPDVARILSQNGLAEREKTPWTSFLALETAKELLQVEGNIIIADAPGGSPDKITEIVIGPADLAILLVAAEDDQSWKRNRHLWRKALQKIGIKAPVLLRSRRLREINPEINEEIESSLTSFSWAKHKRLQQPDWIERVGGRIVDLNMKVKREDPCISLLAKLLVFDLLPQVVINRKWQTWEYLTKLRADYEST